MPRILCCYRFRTGVKDLEVMMQNVINSAFETVTTVEGGIEVLDVMMRLATREVCLSSCSLTVPVMLFIYKCANVVSGSSVVNNYETRITGDTVGVCRPSSGL